MKVYVWEATGSEHREDATGMEATATDIKAAMGYILSDGYTSVHVTIKNVSQDEYERRFDKRVPKKKKTKSDIIS